jgi:hypothetical protein
MFYPYRNDFSRRSAAFNAVLIKPTGILPELRKTTLSISHA